MRLHWPVALRPAFDALFDLDDAMADVVARASEPALAAIKLAWWREALERLDTAPPPAEPRLTAAASELLPRGLTGRELAGLEAGWAELLQEEPDLRSVQARGELLFALGGRLLGASHVGLGDAGGALRADRRHQAGRARLPGRRPLGDVAPVSAKSQAADGACEPRQARPAARDE